jgi:Family of unknown function (DUF6356)
MARWSFTEHPASVNESYLKHMGVAGGFGWAMLKGAGACFVHALLPFLFTRTGSGIITELHGRMVSHRHRDPLPAAERSRQA